MEEENSKKVEANQSSVEEISGSTKPRNSWKTFSIILILAVIVLVFYVFKGSATGNVVSEKTAADTIISYLNTKVGGGVSYISAKDVGSMYEVTVSYQNDSIPVYITKDAKYFVQGAIPIAADTGTDTTGGEQEPTSVPKSDKPIVELFVMTFCPYGTQAEKGLIPVIEAFKDKIDANIRFVHYFMHGDKEEQETYRQICIREEQSAKYLAYLKCFLSGDGKADSTGYIANGKDPETCIKEVGIDKAKLTTCIADKSKTLYASDSDLSNAYGVQGSPTLVINGVQVSSGRSSSAYASAICAAFNTAPAECKQTFSSVNPTAGFGFASGTSGTAAAAQCG